MRSKEEIILSFPLLKSLRQKKSYKQADEKFKNLKEKELYQKHVIENEWQQEYYLIYNSYVLENI